MIRRPQLDLALVALGLLPRDLCLSVIKRSGLDARLETEVEHWIGLSNLAARSRKF
jgi:hypothetical protein